MKSKVCGICLKEVPALWKAKRKLPDGTIQPGMCRECSLRNSNNLIEITIPIIEEITATYANIKHHINNAQTHKKQKPIPKQSEKEKKRQAAYKVVRKYYLTEHPTCDAMIYGCTHQATQIHHKKGKIGSLLIDMKFFLATCDSCHKWIEVHPEESKKIGLSLNRLDK